MDWIDINWLTLQCLLYIYDDGGNNNTIGMMGTSTQEALFFLFQTWTQQWPKMEIVKKMLPSSNQIFWEKLAMQKWPENFWNASWSALLRPKISQRCIGKPKMAFNTYSISYWDRCLSFWKKHLWLNERSLFIWVWAPHRVEQLGARQNSGRFGKGLRLKRSNTGQLRTVNLEQSMD